MSAPPPPHRQPSLAEVLFKRADSSNTITLEGLVPAGGAFVGGWAGRGRTLVTSLLCMTLALTPKHPCVWNF